MLEVKNASKAYKKTAALKNLSLEVEEGEFPSKISLDFQDEWNLLENPSELVNRLDILLACGRLSDTSKGIIAQAVSQVEEKEDQLDLALYLIMISPEYAVVK